MLMKMTKAKLPATRHSPMEHPRHQYPEETAALGEIALGCGLVERIKWGKPCFTLGGRNVVLIQRFNEYIALMFFKGALLKDAEGLLCQIGEMQAPRQLRFRSVEEIHRLRPVVKAYIEQAIELERTGAKIARKSADALPVPDELQARLDADPPLRKAFTALTPGRRKAYIYRIADAKQSATRAARVEKFVPQILAGKGIDD